MNIAPVTVRFVAFLNKQVESKMYSDKSSQILQYRYFHVRAIGQENVPQADYVQIRKKRFHLDLKKNFRFAYSAVLKN